MIAYQGSKRSAAKLLVRKMDLHNSSHFYEMCCGSGEISLEFARQGGDPKKITMVDIGPWGYFWKRIGEGSFDIARFRYLCSKVPQTNLKEWAQEIREKPAKSKDGVYRFVLLQALSFGGQPITYTTRNTFSTKGFRPNLCPSVEVVLGRVIEAARLLKGVQGICGDSLKVKTLPGSTVFYDPPYEGHNPYQTGFDISKIPQKEYFITYSSTLSEDSLRLHRPVGKGGVQGQKGHVIREYFNRVHL
jgi:site-specific DNA-adenine methylase